MAPGSADLAEVPSTDSKFVLLSAFRACYGVLRFIMESGAKGCEVVVSGKLRGQRAKSMKFVDGLMIHSGDPVNYYVDTAVRHVLLRQGEWLSLLFFCFQVFWSQEIPAAGVLCLQVEGFPQLSCPSDLAECFCCASPGNCN